MAKHIAAITINASAHKIFEALTQSELIKLWQYNRVVTTSWRAGSEIRFKTETAGSILEQWGTILEVKPNELIKYNLFTPRPDLDDKPENYCVTSYLLTNDNEQTKVEII